MVASPGVVVLAKSGIRDGGEVLARAFHDDPFCSYFIPCAATRERALPWFMSGCIRCCQPFETVFVTPGGMDGVAAWLPPGHVITTLSQMLSAGLLEAPFRIGLKNTLRFLKALNRLDEIHGREVPQSHWYLMWLGVSPSSRGQGIGSALLTAVTSRADSQGLPCYLQNTKAENEEFYRKHGFQVVSQVDLPEGGPRIWTMRREPLSLVV